ncbi:hypothetical protein [Cellulomonas fengjieae]|uniref:DUF2273 domain-containing protein n=1 Tax=Cellulomonas fengjieae TaxID=2819978 RepID=A0ABS3SK91_9CELL|nr:hypothetical protein [Cellulomonas fengjieae]MBO3086169.1 hypothetical protein [Cellulomonas fengjieae]MBO3102427.1 hypothetical protein [Cellulomonas fengjieae]QVI65772.1 DUF2273 domain-containing protein [Cellulomonas fengjieae]
MSSVAIGLFAGLLLALVAAVGGFSMFVLALVLGAVGVVVGLAVDGRIDIPGLAAGRGRG